MKKTLLLIVITLLISLGLYTFVNSTPKNSVENNNTIEENTSNDIKNQNHRFMELGVYLNVPTPLEVTELPNFNLEDTTKLDSFTFFIQNPTDSKVLGTEDFQIYGIYQFDLPPVTLAEFNSISEDTSTYSYINPITIGGINGFEGQYKGERANYIYLFHLNNQILKISVSPATPENKVIADDIIKSLGVFNTNRDY